MKVIIKDPSHNKKEIPFPKLMCSTHGKIVYFKSPKEGVLLYDPNNTKTKWDYSEIWAPEKFVDFEGTITLSN